MIYLHHIRTEQYSVAVNLFRPLSANMASDNEQRASALQKEEAPFFDNNVLHNCYDRKKINQLHAEVRSLFVIVIACTILLRFITYVTREEHLTRRTSDTNHGIEDKP